MPRNLDTALAAELAKGSVRPFYLCELTLASGVQHVWSGVGPLVWNGNTYSGLGELAEVGAVHESSGVQADGTTITLNIAPSQLAIPPLEVTPPAGPRATVAGESLAWSFAGRHSGEVDVHNTAPSGFGFDDVTGHSSASRSGGTLELINGWPLGANSVGADWLGYNLPLEVPAGARITGVYPVVVCTTSGGGSQAISYDTGTTSGLLGPGSGGIFYGPNIGSASSVVFSASVQNTLGNGDPPVVLSLIISFVGLAVYYMGSPLTKTSLLYEAMSDVRVGAPVKLWFGMLSAAGAIVGQPFLTFSGLVDEPTITEDPSGTKIVLALESRLRNHARASGRRYTAADQKLNYPNDSGFNWVEILNEISLKWGS